jgi:hypothetical protein
LKNKYTYYFSLIIYICSFSCSAFELSDTIITKKDKPKNNLKSKIFVPPLVIKTSPTAFLAGAIIPYTSEYLFMVEVSSGKRQSEQIGISYLGKNWFLRAYENQIKMKNYFMVTGWKIQYAHKFFWIGRRHYAPYGFYVAPMISYSNARIALGLKRYYQHAYFDFRHFNINGIIGVQAGKLNRVTLDVYAGAGYKVNKVFYHSGDFQLLPYDTKDFGEFYNSHVNLLFGINLGYSF